MFAQGLRPGDLVGCRFRVAEPPRAGIFAGALGAFGSVELDAFGDRWETRLRWESPNAVADTDDPVDFFCVLDSLVPHEAA